MTRRPLLLLLGLPAVLLALAWFGPRMLDWETQRGRVAAIAEARLGRSVTLGGPLHVTLLPQPMVEAERVVLGAAEGTELGITARALRLRLGLLPLLVGRLEPRDVVLVGAEIRLPWPPTAIGTLRPPPWLTDVDARIEDSRVAVGGAVLEGVAARLAAPGPIDAVRAEGSFTARGVPVTFEAVIGRPGADGAATLDLVLGVRGAHTVARGLLVADGGFEGRIEAAGNDLSGLTAAPPLPFRAAGRLAVTGEVAAADDLALDIGGVTGRGAVTFRFAPMPRLDLALSLARLDLDAWIGALRRAQAPPLPIGLDLSAELASFGGASLRSLRVGLMREGDRFALSGLSAQLPGEAQLDATGSAEGSRLELVGRIAGPSLRATLAGFGLAADRIAATRLRGFEARAELTLDPAQLTVREMSGSLDEARLSGAGVLRFGARPALALGVTTDRLDLDGLVPADVAWADVLRAAPPFDGNLRLAAEALSWHGVQASGVTLDVSLDQGRVALRRAAARIGQAEATLAGGLVLGPTPRFADVAFELGAPDAGPLAGALAPALALPAPLLGNPLRLRMAGGGPPEALALAAEAELGELRAAVQGTLAVPQGRATGSVTLRHPGAPRLMTLLGAPEPPAWLGEGSFSLIANLRGSAAGISAENFDLVAGGLRARGLLGLALDGARPRLTGRIAADRLPLPGLPARDAEPLALAPLARLDADVAIEAAEVAAPDLPALETASARVQLDAGRLTLDALSGRLGGGMLEGRIELEGAATPPRLSGALGLTGATLSGPVFGTPLDLAAGQVEAQGRFSATGHGPAALLATFEGSGRIALTNGVLSGVALAAAAAAAGLEDPAAAEADVRAALDGGATAVDRLAGGWRAAAGQVALEGVSLAAEGGATGDIEGSIDLGRAGLDLRLSVQPGAAEAPPIALRVTGPAQAPRRQPEVAAWARWRAEH